MAERSSLDVVVPVLDGEATIARTLAAILGQRGAAVRVVVVDDGSRDGTIDAIRAVADRRTTILRRDRSGPSAARNAGAAVGAASHIAFVDCDDVVHPGWAQTMLSSHAEAAVISCAGRFLRPGHDELIRAPERLGPEYHHSEAIFLPGLFVVRREVFEAVGGYDEQLRFSENTDLGFRLTDETAARGLTSVAMRQVLIDVHLPTGGRSQSFDHCRVWSAAERMLEKHADRLKASPRHLGSWHAIAGVNALACGERGRARHHLRHAVRLAPRAPRYWARLAQAYALPTGPSALHAG